MSLKSTEGYAPWLVFGDSKYAKKLAAAIVKSIAEHGAPNRFTFGELHARGAPPPMIAAKALPEVIACDLVAGYRVERADDGSVSVEKKA